MLYARNQKNIHRRSVVNRVMQEITREERFIIKVDIYDHVHRNKDYTDRNSEGEILLTSLDPTL